MADEPTQKKVVRRVVKKPADEPTIRYGRPAPALRITQLRVRQAREGAPSTPEKPDTTRRTSPVARARAAGKTVARGVDSSRGGLKSARDRMVVSTRRAGDGILEKFWSAVYAVKDWWLPQLRPVTAALVTGLITGLAAVALGYVVLLVFSWLRGVAGGGGTWGSLTFVVVAFAAFAVGEWLLGQFGVASARLISILGVITTIIALLGLFLGLSDSRWAVVVVPVAASVAFAASSWLIAMADGSEPERSS